MANDDTRPGLELSPDAMREMVAAAMDRIVSFVESLPDQPASDTEGGAELARSLVEDLPETGEPFPRLLDLVFDRLVPNGINTTGPGFLAYIPGGGLFHAAVADLVADVTNRYVTVWQAAPGLVQLEANVIRWFCQMLGYPSGAGGFLATGGSLASFSAVVAARRDRLPDDFLSGVLYVSDQTHHSVLKAALLAGFSDRNFRTIPSDPSYRIRIDLLEEQIRDDRAARLTPFLIVGSAGTTNTGAVDDLEGLAEVARREKLWLHLDAAYGGFFVLTERGRRLMRGIDAADSITLDPHKGLFLPYGTGCLLARDRRALQRAHSVRADYMPTLQDAPDRVDFCDISPELSREFRGLRVWLPLKMHGAGAFREALDEKLDLAQWAWHELEKIDGIEIVAEPQLSLVAFRLHRPGLDPEQLDRLNRELLDRINARRRIFLTGTTVGDRFVLRICVLSYRTHLDRMKLGLEDIRRSVAEVLGSY